MKYATLGLFSQVYIVAAFSVRRATARSRAAAGGQNAERLAERLPKDLKRLSTAEKNSNLSNLSDLSAVAACTATSAPAPAAALHPYCIINDPLDAPPHPAMSRHDKPAREPIGIGDERSGRKDDRSVNVLIVQRKSTIYRIYQLCFARREMGGDKVCGHEGKEAISAPSPPLPAAPGG